MDSGLGNLLGGQKGEMAGRGRVKTGGFEEGFREGKNLVVEFSVRDCNNCNCNCAIFEQWRKKEGMLIGLASSMRGSIMMMIFFYILIINKEIDDVQPSG